MNELLKLVCDHSEQVFSSKLIKGNFSVKSVTRIDWGAETPQQIYAILNDIELSSMYDEACEALQKLTRLSSRETKLELLELALNYHIKIGRGFSPLNFDLHKFATNLSIEDYQMVEMFFTDEINALTEPNCVNSFHHTGVKCLEMNLKYSQIQSMEEAQHFLKFLSKIQPNLSDQFEGQFDFLCKKVEQFKIHFEEE